MKLSPQLNYKKASFLRQTEQLIRYKSVHTIVNGKETDTQFIQDIKRLHQLKCTSTKFIFQNNKENLSQEQLKQIDRKCRLHAQATKFSSNSSTEFQKLKQKDRCQCGCNKGKGKKLSIFSNEQSFTFLGQGVLLYFLFQKKVIILIIVCALLYGLYNVVTNFLLSQYVQSPLCQKSTGFLRDYCRFRYQLSVQNKSHGQIEFHVQIWLGLLVTLIWTFGLRMIRVLGFKKSQAVDLKLQSSAAHCIVIDDLPFGKFNQKQIKQFLLQIWNKIQNKRSVPPQLSIRSMQIIYKMEETRNIINKLDRKLKQIGQFIIDQNQKQDQFNVTFQSQAIANQSKFKIKRNKVQDANQNQQKVEQKRQILKLNLRLRTRQPQISAKTQNTQRLKKLRVVLPPIKLQGNSSNTKSSYQHIKREKLKLYTSAKQSIIQIYQQLKTYRWMFLHNAQFRKKLSTSICLVQFSDTRQKNLFLQEYGTEKVTPMKKVTRAIKECLFKDEQSLSFKNQHVRISKAPEPSDIDWANCQKKNQIHKNIKVWGILVLIIGLSFGMLNLVRFIRTRWEPLNNMTLFAAFSLQVFNRIIAVTVAYIIKFEQNNTKTASILSVMTKSSLAQAVNVIFLPLLLNTYQFNNFSGPNGLVGVVVDYQILVCFTMMLWNLVDISYIIQKFSLWVTFIRNMIIISKTKSSHDKINQYQKIHKVLEYYQPPELPIAAGYVYMITVINQAFFFCHLQPVLLFLLIFNVCVFLLINKYLLYKRSKLPALTEFLVFQTCTSIAKKVPLMYGLGSLFFICYTNGNFYHMLPSLLCIVVSILDMLNPNKIFTKITTFFIDISSRLQESGESGKESESSINFFKQPSVNQNTTQKQKSQIHPQNVKRKNITSHLYKEENFKKTGTFFQFSEVSKEGQSQNQFYSQSLNASKNIQNAQLSEQKSLQYDIRIHRQDRISQDSGEKEDQIQVQYSGEKGDQIQVQDQNRLQSQKPIVTLNLIQNQQQSRSQDQEKFNLDDFMKVVFSKTISILQQSTRKQSYSKSCNINQLLYFQTYFMTTNTAYPSKRSQQFFSSFGFEGQPKSDMPDIMQ